MHLQLLRKVKNAVCVFVMPSFKKFYKENRKKAIQSQKNSLKLLQLLMILCSYNFIKFSMCSYNFNVAVRISINLPGRNDGKPYSLGMVLYENQVLDEGAKARL